MLSLEGFDSTVCYNCVGSVFWSLDQTERKTCEVPVLIKLITMNEPLVIVISDPHMHSRQEAVNFDKRISKTSFNYVR